MMTEAHLNALMRASLFRRVTGLGMQDDSWEGTPELLEAKRIYWLESFKGTPRFERYELLQKEIDRILTEQETSAPEGSDSSD